MKQGTPVKHKIHGFEGIVLNRPGLVGQVKVGITNGKHPYESEKGTYTGHYNSWEVIEEKKLIVPEPAEESEDTFDAELTLSDGTEIKFDTVEDLIKFTKAMNNIF